MNKILNVMPESLRRYIKDSDRIKTEAMRPYIDDVIRAEPLKRLVQGSTNGARTEL